MAKGLGVYLFQENCVNFQTQSYSRRSSNSMGKSSIQKPIRWLLDLIWSKYYRTKYPGLSSPAISPPLRTYMPLFFSKRIRLMQTPRPLQRSLYRVLLLYLQQQIKVSVKSSLKNFHSGLAYLNRWCPEKRISLIHAMRSLKLQRDFPTWNGKTLVLGTGESGKSTLVKSFKLYIEGSYNLEERSAYQRNLSSSNVIQSARVVLEAMESLQLLCRRSARQNIMFKQYSHAASTSGGTIQWGCRSYP